MNRTWLARTALLAAVLGVLYVMRGKAPVETDVTVQFEGKSVRQVNVRVGTLEHEWLMTAKFPTPAGSFVMIRPHVPPGTYLVEVEVESEASPRTQAHPIVLDGNPVTVYGPRAY